ncbi:MAG: hypothetical protein EOM67_14000 [Spirochaetia bacterium]|nr:hypothetical protein [Spirochaetia bacterium]
MRILHNLLSKVNKSEKDKILSNKNIRVGFEFEFIGPLNWNDLVEKYEEYFYSSDQAMLVRNLDAKDIAYFSWMSKEAKDSTMLVSNIGESKSYQARGYDVIVPDASVSDDGDDFELVTRPLPLSESLSNLYTILNGIQSKGYRLSDKCSLHVGISFKGINLMKDLDYVKLFMFLDEGKVYSQMPSRKDNSYAINPKAVNPHKRVKSPEFSVALAIANLARTKDIDLTDLDKALPKLVPHFRASKSPVQALRHLFNKFASVNLTVMKDGYIEFRLLGGHKYASQYAFIRSTILEFCYAVQIACTKDREDEYKKRLKRYLTKDVLTSDLKGESLFEALKSSL